MQTSTINNVRSSLQVAAAGLSRATKTPGLDSAPELQDELADLQAKVNAVLNRIEN